MFGMDWAYVKQPDLPTVLLVIFFLQFPFVNVVIIALASFITAVQYELH